MYDEENSSTREIQSERSLIFRAIKIFFIQNNESEENRFSAYKLKIISLKTKEILFIFKKKYVLIFQQMS